MGELGERRWAVVSERGCEASSLVYDEAARLVRRLLGEKMSGLCVVTDAAAGHLVKASRPSPNGKHAAQKSARRQTKRAAKTP